MLYTSAVLYPALLRYNTRKKMNITDLPRQSEENDITRYTEDVEEVKAGFLSGNYCPEVLKSLMMWRIIKYFML